MGIAPHAEGPPIKYVEQARRRMENGRCHHTPYLGTREFAAWFEPASGEEAPLALDMDMGNTLFDIAYREDPKRTELTFRRHGRPGTREAAGYAEALFFIAMLRGGVLKVPQELYRELYHMEGRDA